MSSIGRKSPTVLLLVAGFVSVACERPAEPPPAEEARSRAERNRLEALKRENRALREELVRLHLDLAPEPAAIDDAAASPASEDDGSTVPQATSLREEELRQEVERLQKSLTELEMLFEALGASYEMSELERGRLAERIDLLLAEYERGR